MKLLRLFLVLTILVCLPFVLWGGQFEQWFSGEAGRAAIQRCGAWAWAAGIGLLVADLVLPVPSTAIMSTLGWIYGGWWGGLFSAAGSFLSGVLGYGLCRMLGPRMAARLAGKEELARYEALFAKRGILLVALSRCLPVLPEIVSCLAGLTRMDWRKFLVALACGSLPMGMVFAFIGAAGQDRPGLALALSLIMPMILASLSRCMFKDTGSAEETASS